MKILLVDDDPRFSSTAKTVLEENLYDIDILDTGKSVFLSLETNSYDLLILDVMIPYVDGISLCRELRKNNYEIPILLLTALQGRNDKMKAFEAGGDDYLVKPFDWDELLARIRALLRRKENKKEVSSTLEWEKLKLKLDTKQSSYNDKILNLTPTEYKILEILLSNPNKLFSLDNLVNQLWDLDDIPTNSTIRSHIKGLRKKIQKAGGGDDLIQTVYGMGYRLKTQENSPTIKNDELEKNTDSKEVVEAEIKSIKTSKVTKNLENIEVDSDTKSANKEVKKQKISTALLKIWQEYKKSVFDDLESLQEYNDKFDPHINKEEVVRKSHNLVGFLGSIGLLEASDICKKLELLFKGDDSNENDIKKEVKKEIKKLFEYLEKLDDSELKSSEDLTLKVNQNNKQILMIDEPSNLTNKLTELSNFWNLDIELVNNFEEAIQKINNPNFEAIILDPFYSKNSHLSSKILSRLKEKIPNIPIIIVTEKDDLKARLEATKFKVSAFISKKIHPEKIIEIIYDCLDKSETYKILLVDDDPKFLNSFKAKITDNNLEVITINDPLKLWNLIENISPELLILDLQMPNISGIDLCKVVRNDPRWYKLPIIFLTAYLDNHIIDQMIAAGADDFITKSKIGLELHHRIMTHLQRSQRLKKVN